MSQHARPVGPGINDAAPITSSMFVGYQPERNRQVLGPRIPLPLHIPHVVDAPFTSSMSAGYQPDRGYKIPQITHLGWQSREPDVTSAAIEQTIGYHPDSPLRFPPRRGPSFFPWSGTTPFSVEQVIGYQPSTHRIIKRQVQGQQILPSVDAFSIEMVVGSHPDRNRAVLGPKIDLPTNPTFVQVFAPVTIDMMVGNKPDRNRAFAPKNQGGTFLTSDQVQFSIDMTQGYHPDRNRAFSYPKTGWSDSQTTFPVQMTPDMFAGNRPDSPRIRLGAKIPLPLAQTTQVNAPITLDMLRGSQPEKGFTFKLKEGARLMPTDTITPPPIAFHTETNAMVPFNPQPWIK